MSVVRTTAGLLNAPLRRTGWDFVAVALGAAFASGLSFAYYRSAGLILLHGDAVSRMNIARRVFDSLDPGLVQLGVIWPPAPQVLMLPLIWIDPLWRSGLAGSIPSMVAFVGAAVYLYALGQRLTGTKLGGVIAWLVFVTNPSMLYLQAVPLSESLMLLTMVAAAYHLAVWLQEEKTSHLIAAAIWVFVATMTRYEGWALVLGGALIVAAFTLTRYRDRRRAEALALMFIVPAAFGIVLWLIYSAVIFGDPLSFAHGVGTAREHADYAASQGKLLTKWNLPRTMATYGWTVVDVEGLPAIGMAALGVATVIVGRVSLRQSAAAVVLFVPALVVISSLFLGSAVLFDPHAVPPGFTDTRYGVLALPAIAIFAAFPAALHRLVAVLLIITTLSVAAFSYQHGDRATAHSGTLDAQAWISSNYPILSGLQPLVVVDGLNNETEIAEPVKEATDWLRAHRGSGQLVLISANANDEFMFYSRLPLRDYVFEGAQPYWDDEMRSPGAWTDWIVIKKGYYGEATYFRDLVGLKLGGRVENSPGFELAFENGIYKIYKVIRPAPERNSEAP